MTAIEFNPGSTSTARTVSFQHDWTGDEPLSLAIVSTVETLLETEPTELETLYDRVDPDALEALFEPRADSRRDDGHVGFHLSGCEVTVYGDGFVVVRRFE